MRCAQPKTGPALKVCRLICSSWEIKSLVHFCKDLHVNDDIEATERTLHGKLVLSHVYRNRVRHFLNGYVWPKLTNKEAEFYFVILNSNPSFFLVYSPYVSQPAAWLLAIHLKRLAWLN